MSNDPPEDDEDSKSIKDEVREMLEEMDINDIKIPEKELDYDSVKDIPHPEIPFGTIERPAYKPLPPTADYTSEETLTIELENGVEIQLKKKHRPQCPSCERFVEPDEEDIVGCGVEDCENHFCGECRSTCSVCSQVLCLEHSTQYQDSQSLCPDHAEQSA